MTHCSNRDLRAAAAALRDYAAMLHRSGTTLDGTWPHDLEGYQTKREYEKHIRLAAAVEACADARADSRRTRRSA